MNGHYIIDIIYKSGVIFQNLINTIMGNVRPSESENHIKNVLELQIIEFK